MLHCAQTRFAESILRPRAARSEVFGLVHDDRRGACSGTPSLHRRVREDRHVSLRAMAILGAVLSVLMLVALGLLLPAAPAGRPGADLAVAAAALILAGYWFSVWLRSRSGNTPPRT